MPDSLHGAVARAIADELGWSRTQIDAQRAAAAVIRVVLAEAQRSIETCGKRVKVQV